MSDWSLEHAQQLIAARDVLDGPRSGLTSAEVLYERWYAVRSPLAVGSRRWDAPVSTTARAAHRGATDWSSDECEVLATGIAGVVVVSGPRGRRALCRGEYVTTHGRPGFPPRVGDRVRTLSRIGAVVHDGWWRTWGSDWDPQHPEGPLVRVYLRPSAGSVARLVSALTATLGPTGTWLLKVAPTSDGLGRPDGVVAYLGGPDRDARREAVAGAVAGLTAGQPPPLTARLDDGIGWAEDPGTGESFGEVRCGAIATAYENVVEGDRDPSRWLTAVASEFRSRGIDPAQPHRSPTSVGVLR